MSNTLLLKRSATPGSQPSTGNLTLGELAINTYDGRLFTKIDDGTASIFELTQNQPITATGNVTGTSVNGVGNSTIALTLSSTGVAAGTYGGTSGSSSNIGVFTVDQYGRITSASNVGISTSDLANGNASISIYANGNISVNPAGTSNVAVFSNTGQYLTGFLSVTGNVVGGNIVTNGVATVAGTITAGNVDTGGTVSATGNVTGGNLVTTGLITATGNAIVGNLSTAGLISATGNLTSGNVTTSGLISATGNLTSGNVSTAGNVAAGGVLTDNYYYANGTPVDFQQAAGSNTQLQFNNNNDFGASANLTFDSATDLFTIVGTASVSGNITGGNLITGGYVTATGNVTGGNLVTTGVVTTTANVIAGNVTTTGNVSATGNVTGGNLIATEAFIGNVSLTGNVNVANVNATGLISAVGNVIAGNVTTGGSVSATGNVTGGNLVTAGVITTTANVVAGNVTTGGNVSATGNVTGGNLVTTGVVTTTANVIAGNVTTGIVSASGNVTGANFLTTGLVSATGNVDGGNLIATTAVVTGNINPTGTLSITTGSGDLDLNPTGNINVNSNYINNLLTPLQATDAATKQYVDDAVSAGITIHTPVYVETPDTAGSLNATYADGGTTQTVTDITGSKTLTFGSSPALQVNDIIVFSSSANGLTAGTAYFVYSTNGSNQVTLSASYNGVEITTLTNGTGLSIGSRANSGVGATLTNAGANAALTIDGVTLTTNQRVLVYNQTNAYENGVYVVTTVGAPDSPGPGAQWVLTRSSDTNKYGEKSPTTLDIGDYFFVQAGDTGAGESYVLTAPNGPIIFGTTNLTFTQFGASQVYSANTAAGLTLVGTVFNAKVDNNTTAFDGSGNIVVKASANLTTPNIGAATGTSLSVSGNVSGGNINFDAGIVSGTGNVVAGNAIVSGLISVTGNVTSGNVSTGIVTASGNITGGNLITNGLVSVGGTVTAANVQLSDTANVANLIVRTFANITSTTVSTSNVTGALRVAGGIGVTGNVYADGMYVLGDSVLTVNSTIDCGTY